MRVARFALELYEEVLVSHVRRDRHHLGITQSNQLGVDHRAAGPDVGQEPPVAIPSAHVQLEANVPAIDETAIHLGRVTTAGLFALDRVVDLRRVDADVADLLDAIGELHVDRVAVDDADDRAFDRTGRRGARREDQQKQNEKMGSAKRHADTVSPRVDECQELETVVAGLL